MNAAKSEKRVRENGAESAYARAGVDIDAMNRGLSGLKKMIRSTATSGVRHEFGSFGGLFDAPGKDALLVASTDGVGTKLKVAAMIGRHGTVGQDLVNHCVNDILVQGAQPLFFLDYLGTARLEPKVFHAVVSGICKACRENGCALLGGETAEMPGLYPEGEYDLVGTIVGSVPRRALITGAAIRPGDVMIGLASGGLQTNGYSLARKILFEEAGLKPEDLLPGTRRRVADVLLDVHRSFLAPVRAVMDRVRIRGMAHITGGGFVDNLPRVLPEGCRAVVDQRRWRVPPVFRILQTMGTIASDEMFRVFNMGIGFVLFVRAKDADLACSLLREKRAGAAMIGHVEAGKRGVRLDGDRA